jgi:hypothetical protein
MYSILYWYDPAGVKLQIVSSLLHECISLSISKMLNIGHCGLDSTVNKMYDCLQAEICIGMIHQDQSSLNATVFKITSS